jgi:RHS repeat-associated protein
LLSLETHRGNREAIREGSYGRFLYNFYRTYDPATGRYLEADPIGQDGGLNLYGYTEANPLNFVDPLGLKYTPEQCERLLERIRNTMKTLQRRGKDLLGNPRNLPGKHPLDALSPGKSRRGHAVYLIPEDAANLAARMAEYLIHCTDDQCPPGGTPDPGESFFDWKYWEEVTGLTGAALVVYLVVSEGTRLFPPRNLVPVP